LRKLGAKDEKYKQLKIKAKKSNKTSSLIGAKYVENFGKSLKVFFIRRTKYRQ